MRVSCAACGAHHPESLTFCTACGAALLRRCRRCGFDNPQDAAFCGQCAAPVRSAAAAARTASVPAAPVVPPARLPEAERRQLTVMFCDLVGSTELSRRLDPEDLRDVMRAYHETCGAVVGGLGGHVTQYLGDGVVVFFGWPQAHEDDPMRAVHAGLALHAALPALTERVAAALPVVRAPGLQARIGIHTGPVVVGALAGVPRLDEFSCGDTMNIAARLQAAAPPGTVVISPATRRLVGGAFLVEELGGITLKGIAEPIAAARVLRATAPLGGRSRGPHAAHPLIGREQELSLLLDRWEQVADGLGQVVLVSGESGMGKSRLVRALRDRLAGTPHAWLESGCSAYHENSAFHPVVECLEQCLAFGHADDADTRLAKLEAALRATDVPLAEGMPLFAALLGMPAPPAHPALDHMTAKARRHKTLDLTARWLFGMSEEQPVVLVLEDLHWADPSTLELLRTLVEQAPTARVLLILTHRPEFDAGWANRSHVVHLALHPLTRSQVTAIIERIAGDVVLPPQILAQVAEKTDGVPLFVEELTRAILESPLMEVRDSLARVPALAIPATLQDSLMARLDRLGPTKEVAQLASVVGREVSYELLAAVSPIPGPALTAGLDRLVEAELVYRRGTPPRATYTFKHALVQETAYQSLLKRTRQEYHRRLAAVLETRFPERAAAAPEAVARHYEEGGSPALAVPWYERAGERAAERSAHREAVCHLERGIALLPQVEASVARDQQELRLQGRLGARLLEARGYGHRGVERAYARARELGVRVGDTAELFRALWGLSVFYQARNDLETALDMGRSLMGIAERADDPTLLMMAHMALGSPYLWQGDFARCLAHVQQATALYDPARHRPVAQAYGENPGVSSRVYGSVALWFLGRPERARGCILEAVAVAEDAGHPFSLGYALSFAAMIHVLLREPTTAWDWAERAVTLAEKQHLALWRGTARFYRGYAQSLVSGDGAHLPAMVAALTGLGPLGTKVGAPAAFGFLAEVHAAAGDPEQALATLGRALGVAARGRAAFWNAELHRLEGETRQKGGDVAAAEALFRRGLEVARAQGARALELRAATSLGRLLAGAARPDEARDLLAPVYRTFTEGHDVADLADARALLQTVGWTEPATPHCLAG